MKLAKTASVVFFACLNAFAVTNQFRGVSWADKRDNFVSDVLVLSGTSLSDTYEAASVIADRIVGQFVELLGTNSVRIPVNEPTISKFWNTYKGIIDASLKHGRVLMGYWGPAQPSGPKNMDDWWAMWGQIVKDYGNDPNAYFEVFNEPHMYNKTQLRDLYAQWLQKFPDVPRDHIILDGTGMAQNVPDIADDSRFDGCLFAVHEYTFWNMSINTESGWRNSFKGKVGKYADRTVCTEWGGAMSPGDKAGVHYEYMDYNTNPTNYFMAYIRGMSDQLNEWQMGSFYWPGLRDGDWYGITKREGEGANIKLSVTNQSGLDRIHRAWTDTVETTPVVNEPFSGSPIMLPGVIQAEDYDKGGNRHSFFDKDSENKGKAYREDAVDVVGLDCSDSAATKDCKGYAVGYTEAGEWMEYSVKVDKKEKFAVVVRGATASENVGVLLSVDGETVGDTVRFSKGEDWDTYSEVSAGEVSLESGEHVIKLTIVGNFLNIDWVKFADSEKPLKIQKSPVRVTSNSRFRVFDVNGKLLRMFDGVSENAVEILKKNGFAAGVYFIRDENLPRVFKVQVAK